MTDNPVRFSKVARPSSIISPRGGVPIPPALLLILQTTCSHSTHRISSHLSQKPRRKLDSLPKMSHEQPHQPTTEALKYGDIFTVPDELSGQPIAPKDASDMQTAENIVRARTADAGPAAAMQSAAEFNTRSGLVDPNDRTDIVGQKGVSVLATDTAGGLRIVTEAVAGQVVAHYARLVPAEDTPPVPPQEVGVKVDVITIGEALEASALSAGEKPVDLGDAAAIEAAEMRARGRNVVEPGGVAASAQSAASANARTALDEEKTTLADLLTDATAKLPADKPVTREDAEAIARAELRNSPNMGTYPGGVAASLVAAATLNRDE
ncbi:late embryogenesis abundant protein D-34-like [Aristolochia californica]|uniref:late embryogenesis abundant protein D-34-like n=1 Tax=Aristolochia californica TaxID=171875 RepID=UPI0035E0BD1E